MPRASWDVRREPTPEEIERGERLCVTCDHHCRANLLQGGSIDRCHRLRYVISDHVRGTVRVTANRDCGLERAGGLIGWIHGLFHPEDRCGPGARFWAPYRKRAAPPSRPAR